MRSAYLAEVLSFELILIPGQTKVADLHFPVFFEEDVLRLEIAVQDAFGVEVVQGRG